MGFTLFSSKLNLALSTQLPKNHYIRKEWIPQASGVFFLAQEVFHYALVFVLLVFLFVCILRPERLKHMDVEILLRHVKIIKWHVAKKCPDPLF